MKMPRRSEAVVFISCDSSDVAAAVLVLGAIMQHELTHRLIRAIRGRSSVGLIGFVGM